MRLDREVSWESLTTTLRWILEQYKKTLNTSLPGLVETYDPATRRARVRIALRKVDNDGKAEERTPAVNVPVLYPSGGGFTFIFPLAEGDPVMLIFSQRGLTEFKKTYELSTPDRTRIMDGADVVAVPGFGPLEVMPATQTGAALQTVDGDDFIKIDEGSITIKVTDGDIILDVPDGKTVHLGGTGGDELATKTFVQNHFNRHIHNHPMGPTAVPAIPAPLTPGSDVTKKTKGE